MLRNVIAYELEQGNPLIWPELELDGSYFSGHRKGNRGRGAAGKIPVFGILERGGKIFTRVIEDASSATLMPIITHKIPLDSVVYTDSWRAYDAIDVTQCRHFRINHSKLFAEKGTHINGIENFWNQPKRTLRKDNGIPPKSFPLFLKGCEFRFNIRSPTKQLAPLKTWKAKHSI